MKSKEEDPKAKLDKAVEDYLHLQQKIQDTKSYSGIDVAMSHHLSIIIQTESDKLWGRPEVNIRDLFEQLGSKHGK